MRALRRLLKKTPLYYAYKSLGHYPDYWYWLLRGKPTRIPHIVKQQTVIAFGKQYGLRTLIETGTYYGEMVSGVKNDFARIVSIEYDAKLATEAKRRFAGNSHVEIMQGSSDVIVARLLETLHEPAFFWLDAGYFLWAGEHKDANRLMSELESIFRHRIPNHVVLIDDVVSWSGRDGTPQVTDLERDLARKYPERKITVESGLMCIRHQDYL